MPSSGSGASTGTVSTTVSAMTDAEILTQLRERIGSPSVDEISDRKLREYIHSSLHWIAGELEYRVVTTANAITLAAGTAQYNLPNDLLRVFWVEWNSIRLEPNSIDIWVRKGFNWRTATSGNPFEYAIEASTIILNQPPSTSAVSTDGYLDLCYISGPLEMSSTGVAGLTDTDLWVAIYKAAAEYFAVRLAQPENGARFQLARDEYMSRMVESRRHHMGRIRPQSGGVGVFSARTGGAR